MPKNKKRHASDGEDEVVSPVVKKAKVKTPSKEASPSKPAATLAKSAEKKTTEKKNTDGDKNEFWDVSFVSFLFHFFFTLQFPPANLFHQLGNKRRIGTSSFKNTLLVNIREYYEADGELKPGKKVNQTSRLHRSNLPLTPHQGISLTVDQYRALVKAIPQLNESLRKAGHEIADPVASPAASLDGGAALEASSPPPPASTSSTKKTSAKREKVRKANIDVTSDEDEEE